MSKKIAYMHYLKVGSERTICDKVIVSRFCTVEELNVTCPECIEKLADAKNPEPPKHHKYQYVVICRQCGIQPLTEAEYERQLDSPNRGWTCPRCHDSASWDDECLETNPSKRNPVCPNCLGVIGETCDCEEKLPPKGRLMFRGTLQEDSHWISTTGTIPSLVSVWEYNAPEVGGDIMNFHLDLPLSVAFGPRPKKFSQVEIYLK